MANFGIGNPFWGYLAPEYELEGLWVIEINDGSNTINNGVYTNTISVNTYFPNGIDFYVQSVSIPQLQLGYEVNDYNLPSFKEKNPYDDVTLNFYDDINGNAISFFSDWLACIFNEEKHCLKKNWRYQTKDIKVTYYRSVMFRNRPIVTYSMLKCLPKSISEISTEEDGGDRKTYSVQLLTQKVINHSTSRRQNSSRDEMGHIALV